MAEDYSEEEIERLQEELATVKRRFSHNKVKRKWVSEEGGGRGKGQLEGPWSMLHKAVLYRVTLHCTILHKTAAR